VARTFAAEAWLTISIADQELLALGRRISRSGSGTRVSAGGGGCLNLAVNEKGGAKTSLGPWRFASLSIGMVLVCS